MDQLLNGQELIIEEYRKPISEILNSIDILIRYPHNPNASHIVLSVIYDG